MKLASSMFRLSGLNGISRATIGPSIAKLLASAEFDVPVHIIH